jgi:hypothetical protein
MHHRATTPTARGHAVSCTSGRPTLFGVMRQYVVCNTDVAKVEQLLEALLKKVNGGCPASSTVNVCRTVKSGPSAASTSLLTHWNVQAISANVRATSTLSRPSV